MGYERIVKNANEIIQTFGTKDPFIISEKLGIPIIYREYGSAIKGYCIKIFDKLHIVINSNFNLKAQKIICAHELGHALLHTEFLHPIFTASFDEGGNSELEHEANIFALALLLDEKSLNIKISDMSNYLIMGIFNDNLKI
ncbi:protein of unknown function [Clostridium sp. USBA 49]|uniref:ImmA/IrrE family metallo-endopeptidase n=1 Tax=Clostridium sp. USBA 49 TaxID=1881060 RepID=UPI00099A2F43|nr:ImmA/IrrE family metallo-endopeptidase [Clostridium sp. USBA 49]SKA89091.1 protein of unknown function [Clostridium sp. USBA 49]